MSIGGAAATSGVVGERGRVGGVACTGHRVGSRRGPHAVEEHGAGHALVGVGVVDRHEPLVAEPHVDSRPAELAPGERFVRLPRGAATRERDRRRRGFDHDVRERAGHVVDGPYLSVHGGHVTESAEITPLLPGSRAMMRRWSATPCRSTRQRAEEWRDRAPAPVPRPGALAGGGRARGAVGGRPRLWTRAAPPVAASPGRRARRRPRHGAARPGGCARRLARAGRPRGAAVPARRARRRLGTCELPPRPHRATAAARSRICTARCTVGAPAHLLLHAGTVDGELADDDFPGRWFAAWAPDALIDVLDRRRLRRRVVHGRRRRPFWVEARIRRARTLPDTVGPGMRLLVCGLNPSVLLGRRRASGSLAPGNRFWPAAIAAGLVTVARDTRAALARRHRHDRPREAGDAQAKELTRDEYRGGLARVERLVRWLQPGRGVLRRPRRLARPRSIGSAVAGVQADGIGGRPAYVMPSTSGLNAAHTAERARRAPARRRRVGRRERRQPSRTSSNALKPVGSTTWRASVSPASANSAVELARGCARDRGRARA